VFYGDGRNLLGSAFDQDEVNSWVRANSSVAIGFDTLSAKNVYGDFLGTTRFKEQSANVIATNTASGSATLHGVYYGWGWELEGVDKGQPGVNTWVRANSSIATGFTTLSTDYIYSDYFGTEKFKINNSAEITTNVAQGSATFHGVYYGDGWNLQGVDRGQPGVNAWVRANSSVATGFTTLCAKSIHGDFIGSQVYKNINPGVIATNTAQGSSTFHGVYYGDGRNLLGVSFDQPEINAWVRSNSAVETLGSFWVQVSAGNSLQAPQWNKTVYGNGRFVSVSYNTENNNTALSLDGKNWTTATASVTALTDIAYGNGLFVATSDLNAPNSSRQIITSINGTDWEESTCFSANWQGVAYGNGYFVAVSNDGYGCVSRDGRTWQNLGIFAVSWKSVCFANNEFKLVASDLVGSSVDTYIATITAPTITTGIPTLINVTTLTTPWYFNSITYNNGIYILTTDETTNEYYTSVDDVTWVQRYLPTSGTRKRCTYGDGLFLLTVNDTIAGTRFYVSKDGVLWNEKYITSTVNTTVNSIGYGNGMFVAGSNSAFFVSGRLRTPNEPVVNIHHGNSIQYGKLTVDGLSANSSSVSFVVENGGELQKRFLDFSIIPQYTFTKDLSVSLSTGKSFGRYVNGNVIASTGKTVPEVLEMSLIEPITPDATLTSSTTVPFASSTFSTVLTLTHKLCSLGATINPSGATKLEYSRDNVSWLTLNTWNASFPNSTTYTHVSTDQLAFSGATNLAGTDVKPLYYRFTVVDTAGASRTVTANITPVSYQAASLVPTAVTTTRYKGDISTTYNGTLTRINTSTVPLSTWQLQRNVSGGGFVSRGNINYFTTNPASSTVTYTDNDPTIVNATSVIYRAVYTDQYLTTKGFGPQVATSSTTSTINFVHKNVYFASTLASITLADIDAVPITATSTLSGALLVSPVSKSRTINSVNTSSTQYIYYVYDAALGNITSIFQNVTQDVTPAFALQAVVTGNNSNGAAVTYRVYRSNAQGPYMSSQPSLTFS